MKTGTLIALGVGVFLLRRGSDDAPTAPPKQKSATDTTTGGGSQTGLGDMVDDPGIKLASSVDPTYRIERARVETPKIALSDLVAPDAPTIGADSVDIFRGRRRP